MLVKKALTGVTEIVDLQIQKSFSHLLIVKTGVAAGFGLERLNVVIKGLASEQSVVPNLKIVDVAMLSQFGVGYQLREVLAGGNIKSAYVLEIGANGALALVNNEYVSVDLKSLTAGASYDIYAFENPSLVRGFLKYETDLVVGTGDPTQRNFPLPQDVASFAIKKNGALDKVCLTHHNGSQVNYTPEELDAIARQTNGIAISADTVVEGDSVNQTLNGGAVEYFIIPAAQYRSAEIYTTGAADLHILKTSLKRF